MFLHYLASGTRDYSHTWAGQRHVHPFWELSVAVRGRIAPVIPGFNLRPRERCMWAIPADLAHGWSGDGSPADVIVLCPRWVPDALVHVATIAVRERRLPTWEMDTHDVRELRAMAAGPLDTKRASEALSSLRQQIAVDGLCLRLLESCPRRWLDGLRSDQQQRVEAACAWYVDHLHEAPTETAVARAVHSSPAHLRRMFHAARGHAPRKEFVHLRLARADALLLHTDWTLDRIATACGLSGGAVSLCRLFRRERGESPSRSRSAENGVSRIRLLRGSHPPSGM